MFYWFLYLLTVFLFYLNTNVEAGFFKKSWITFNAFLILIIGLRYQVGGDWYPYLEGLERVTSGQFEDSILEKYEIGFNLLSWTSQMIGLSIYGVNLVCASIFVLGLSKLSLEQPYPWISIIVATPYLIIVVAMGYTRQSVAIGLLMLGFRFLLNGKNIKFVVLVLLAASFHKPALVFLPFTLLRPGSRKILVLLGISLLVLILGASLILETIDTYYLHYVEENMESAGAQIRIYMNLLPALIFFVYWKQWGRLFDDRWLWLVMSILSIACVPVVANASTAVDRLALYLIPLQVVTWSRLPVLANLRYMRSTALFMIIILYSIVLFVWLYFGVFSSSWIPYDNLLIPQF